MVYIALHFLVVSHIKSFPDVNRWLADDPQIVNLSLHKQMFWMVQMVRCTDVKGVEYLDAKLDGSGNQMLVVAGHRVSSLVFTASLWYLWCMFRHLQDSQPRI